jgi:PmbA protein
VRTGSDPQTEGSVPRTGAPRDASAATGLTPVARRAVESAIAAGATDADAWVEESTTRRVRVYAGQVESMSDAGGRGVGVRAFAGRRSGYAYGTDLSDDGVAEVARSAREAAELADEDEHDGLPEETGVADVDGLASPAFGHWPTERVVELVLEVDRAARAHEGVTQVENSVYSDARGSVALANSRDFAASYSATQAWAYSSAFAGEGADLMTGLGVGMGRDPAALDPEAIGAEAAERALALVGARQPESRRCPVVLDAFVAASFIGFIGAMLSADAVQRGRSLFAGREGEEVADPALRLADAGTEPEGPSSAPFDGEGAPTRRTGLIEDGRLLGFLYDSRTARKAGRATTGNASRGSYRTPPSVGTTNLLVEPGELDLAGLMAEAGEGLYVTDVAGLHSGVNPVSGTFSVGASGRLIENGRPGRPVREITIASDLVSMLKAVRFAGSEARWVPFGGSVRTPPLLVAEMAVSGS